MKPSSGSASARPGGTPADIVGKLNREINAGLASPKIKSQLAELGASPITASPPEYGAFVKAEIEKWEKVIKDPAPRRIKISKRLGVCEQDYP
jgi:tripartite-type tricarboxylate transporter receptor subunit TctC